MEEIVFAARPRTITGKQVKSLRREGLLPAVLYGHTINPIMVSLNLREASRVLPTITSSHLVILDVEGQRHTALVREKQRHPVTGMLLHVDFQVVSLTETLRANVPLILEGEAPAVKEFDGIVVTGLEELEVECLPQDLPERIVVSLAGLRKIGDAIYVRDLIVSDKVEILSDGDEMVVVVTAPEEEKGEAEGLATSAEPEVIEKGKKEEEF